MREADGWTLVLKFLMETEGPYFICRIIKRKLPLVPNEIKARMWARMEANKPTPHHHLDENTEWWTRDEAGLKCRIAFVKRMIGQSEGQPTLDCYTIDVPMSF